MDPDAEQWQQLAELLSSKQALVFFDFAYQGLGNGLDEDAVGLRTFCKEGCELLVSSSFSKNFGLYRERTGALTLVAKDADIAAKSMSVLKQVIRANYSNPPSSRRYSAIRTCGLTGKRKSRRCAHESQICEGSSLRS